MIPSAAVVDFQPGAWALVVLGLLLTLAVWMAIRQRRRTAAASTKLPAGSWTTEALVPSQPSDHRILAVTEGELVMISTKSAARQSWPWAEVDTVAERSMRSRLTSYAGLRISFKDGHTEDLLVPVGNGRAAYADGAREAHRRISERLTKAAEN